jgi:membrane protease YdiL (CAAX protease family)
MPDNSTTPPVPPQLRSLAGPLSRSRSLDFALFVAAILWYLCARAIAASVALVLDLRFDLGAARPLVEASLLLVMLICGLALLRVIEQRRAPLRLTLGLPRRATSRAEWATGAAIGWGLAVASVLPMALARALNVQIWTAPRAFMLLGLGLLTLAIATLAHALAIYGYGFQRLIDATGPVRATMVLMLLTAIHAAYTPTAYGTPDATRILVAMLAALLLSLCWLRTHGLWLLWGVHFAWAAAIAILFGLPLGGDNSFGSIVDTRIAGPVWLTGGEYGPQAALLSVFLLLAAIPVLVRATDEYAWKYTHPPLIPGGYDVTLAPPAAHIAMEQAGESVQTASLVQILPSTPQSPPSE